MTRVAKGVAWIVVTTGIGWGLLKTITPTKEQMTSKLSERGAVAEHTRQRNAELIVSLRRAAGIEDDKMKKEKSS